MAANMSGTTGNNGSTITCYANTSADSNFVANYGCLYTFADAQKVCPTGWKLPSLTELRAFLDYVRSDSNNSDSTKSKNLRATTWSSGADKYGFGALPAGYHSGGYHNFGSGASFWSSTEDDSSYAYYLLVVSDCANEDTYNKVSGFSVRCVKVDCGKKQFDSELGYCVCSNQNKYGSSCDNTYGQMIADGKVYKTTKINGKTWMAENMAATKDKNDNNVNCIPPNSDPASVAKYGCLYTFADAQNICPSGWHLPTKDEFNSLVNYVGDDHFTRSNELRASSWEYGLDTYGFGTLPAGDYDYGSYYGFGSRACFWSSTENDSSHAYELYVSSSNAYVSYIDKKLGNSVRCVQN